MTTIALRDGVLASDSQTTSDYLRTGSFQKVRMIGPYLVGVAGHVAHAAAYFEWLESTVAKGQPLTRPPKDMKLEEEGGFSALLVDRHGRTFMAEGYLTPYELHSPFHAMGSGAAFALGAMECGADAISAVEAAMKWDIGSGGLVQALSVEQLPQPGASANVVDLKRERRKRRAK